jgi:hypothetical protein
MIQIREMWPSGPLRRFATERPNPRWVPLASGGYASSYVCAECRKDVAGVHDTGDGWMCQSCRKNRKCNAQESKTLCA